MPLLVRALSSLILVAIGLISVMRPQWMGVTLGLVKGPKGYRLSVLFSNNPYYLHQIKVVGAGTLLAALVIFIL